MLSKSITKLVQYGMETGLVPECEKNYTTNLLLDVFHEDEYTEPEEKFSGVDLEETLNELLDEAVKRGFTLRTKAELRIKRGNSINFRQRFAQRIGHDTLHLDG